MSSAAGGSTGGAPLGGAGEAVLAGFAKLRGEDFEYYMQTYSIMLGRDTKNSTVDLDLASVGGGMNISRRHARIFYDFSRRRFFMEVLGKNGCLVEGVLHLPGGDPVKLDSQDLLQIGDKKFYFLLPSRSIHDTALAAHFQSQRRPHPLLAAHPVLPQPQSPLAQLGRGGRPMPPELGEQDAVDEDEEVNQQLEKSQTRLKADRVPNNLQRMQLEETDVVSSVATVLSNFRKPGEWMSMETLHAELVNKYVKVWNQSKVKRYLTSEDWPQTETEGRPWFSLIALLRKYPEHFVINTVLKGGVSMEFVSLVALFS